MATKMKPKINRNRMLADLLGDTRDESGLNVSTRLQGAGKKPASAGGKVVVASRLPWPLRIRTFKFVEVQSINRDGTTQLEKVAEPREEEFIIHGTSLPRDGRIPYRISFGYALTEGVDEESFNQWLKDNATQPFVKNGLVFAMRNLTDAEAVARERKSLHTNLEPFEQEGDRRLPRSPVNVEPIVPATTE